MSTENQSVDAVNHPKHYTSHPSGIECIQVVEHMGFNLGNVVKYIWRADLKNDAVEDLKKAAFYLNREIARRENFVNTSNPAPVAIEMLAVCKAIYVSVSRSHSHASTFAELKRVIQAADPSYFERSEAVQ